MAPYIKEEKTVSDIDSTSSEDSPSGIRTALDKSSPIVEIANSQTYQKELLSSAEITPIYTKSCSRHNLAALLEKRLIDILTRMRSNVVGRGKEKLDPRL